MSLGNYTKFVSKTNNYTLDPSDDVATFTIATAKSATMPEANQCTETKQNDEKVVINADGSSDTLTIAVPTDNSLIGVSGLAAGQTAFMVSDGIAVWYAQGGSGVTGVSGFSGFSGASAYSGFSGRSAYSGFSGASGYTGKSGYSGYTGVSGYSGYTGVSGYSGYTGLSGYSGYTGISGFPP
jgi:hypothetical protein